MTIVDDRQQLSMILALAGALLLYIAVATTQCLSSTPQTLSTSPNLLMVLFSTKMELRLEAKSCVEIENTYVVGQSGSETGTLQISNTN